MRQRGVLWVVLAGFVVGLLGAAAVAVSGVGGTSKPSRLPALAIGSAQGEKAMATGDAAAMPIQHVEYRVAGDLPALDDAATVWSVEGGITRADVERVALALGLADPKFVETDEAWVARAGDRELRVDRRTPGAPWYFNQAVECPDAAVSSDGATTGCAVASGGSASSGSAGGTAVAPPMPPDATTSTVEPCPMPDCPPGTACAQVCPQPEPLPRPVPEPQRPGDLPTKAEAERIGRDALAKAGVDLDGATVRVEDGFSQWLVTVDPQIGGRPTMGLTSGVGVGPKGEIAFANGWLGTPTEGDEYPLAGVDVGVQRLKNPGGWSPYPGAPMPAIARDVPATTELTAPAETVPPYVRTITGVRLGLLFAPLADGHDALLVPAYFFRVDDSEFEQPVVAVADEYLPKPQPAPVPLPGEPEPGGQSGQACTGSGGGGAVEVQLCGPTSAKVGERVSFSFTVSSATGAFLPDSCAAPFVDFGDAVEPRAVCDIGCGPANEPRTFGETFTHVYDKPGTYTVSGWVRTCDGAGDLAEPRVEITVRG